MQTDKVYTWLKKEKSRRIILTAFTQPLTARQISRKCDVCTDFCSYTIATFVNRGLLICLNPKARKSRLYWLTKSGKQYHKQLYDHLSKHSVEYKLPDIDWHLYGWACFNYRYAIMKALTTPMQPSEIKRFLRIHQPRLKISTNNIRDVIQLLLSKEIVRPVRIKKKAYRQYELTEQGTKLRQLLVQAETSL